MQKSNRWRLQGKSFYKIFSEVFDPNEYPFSYGILSESIHSSWTKSLDWDLIRNNDSTFSSNALYYKGDVRNLLPLIRYSIRPFELWCEKYQILDSSSQQIFDRIKKYSILIYTKFEEFYDGLTNESNYPNSEGKETSSHKGSSGEYEISEILSKYDSNYLRQFLDSTETEENTVTLTFYRDVAEILDILTRMRNFERNPTGFSLDDATILGLLVNIWKLLKLTILIYKEESAEFAPIPERVLFENAITAIYLLRSDKTILEDFRLCSYRNRIEMLELLATSETENFNNKAGKRLLCSINNKLALEGLENYDFEKQIKNNWRIQGKTFYEIFKEVVGAEHYPVIYGVPSDSVHGTWLDVKQFSLDGNPKQGFLPIYKPLNMSFENVSLIVPLATLPFREWIARVKLETTFLNKVLDFIDSINGRLFEKYGKKLIYHKSA